jgi:hypothetical protein
LTDGGQSARFSLFFWVSYSYRLKAGQARRLTDALAKLLLIQFLLAVTMIVRGSLDVGDIVLNDAWLSLLVE